MSRHWTGTAGNHENWLFDSIVRLRTGDALVFCPTAHLSVSNDQKGGSASGFSAVRPLGNGFAQVRVRRRITADGGKSITADQSGGGAPAASTVDDEIPMFVVETRIPATKEEVKGKKAKKATKKGALSKAEVQDLIPHVLPHLSEILPPILRRIGPDTSQMSKKHTARAHRALEERLGLLINHLHRFPPLYNECQKIIEQPIVSSVSRS